ncbi:MAG: hypothetical protein JXR48_10085 [Candidatus Delongbacteria bacterium]|nr:hypothetical protein [Candidatus Delongbacteria bacterium]MBN2835303.1 hypothetical protein [Candidatus Delongbacteria bacterium]
MIVYLHGFNSSPNPDDIAFLKKIFPDDKIIYPKIDYGDKENIQRTIKSLENHICSICGRTTIIGKSLGGLFARYLSFKTGFPYIVFNPCLYDFKTMKDLEGQTIKNYRDEEYSTIENNISEYYKFFQVNDEYSCDYSIIYLADGDDIVDNETTRKRLSKYVDIRDFHGKHSVYIGSIEGLTEELLL